jgi:2-keto-3-deoxy-L-rhamnonate aldolase RhmA
VNPLIKKMRAGEPVVGLTISELLRPSVVKTFANVGTDFIYIENEHCMLDPTAWADSMLCALDNHVPVVTKTPYLDRGATAKLLDVGVSGYQLPMTESAEDVLTLQSWIKFPPLGRRAMQCGYGSTGYRPVDLNEFIKQQNEDTMLIAHVETSTGVDRIEEILTTGVVDVVFIGQDDMSISVGAFGDHHDPRHVAAIQRVADAARDHEVFFGLFAPTTDSAKRWIDQGALFFEIADEFMLLSASAREAVSSFKQLKR